jgi:hypothetical protein
MATGESISMQGFAPARRVRINSEPSGKEFEIAAMNESWKKI